MKRFSKIRFSYSGTEQTLWFLVWFSLPVSLKLTSMSLILVVLFTVIGFCRRPFRPKSEKLLLLIPFLLFFFWQSRELLFRENVAEVWKETEKQLSWIAISLMSLLSTISRENYQKMVLRGLGSALVLCGLIILPAALIRYIESGNPGEFFYHALASPLHTGAIYLSLYILFVLFLVDWKMVSGGRWVWKTGLLLYLMVLLLLLASKMLLVIGLPLLIIKNFRSIRGIVKYNKWLSAGLAILCLLLMLPLVSRLGFIQDPKPSMAFSKSFSGLPEPNGLQLRLIFLRFGVEILNEQEAWRSGTGMTRAQTLLNYKIRYHGMYLGTQVGTDTGYLNYNFHNQWMETLVRQGIVGLILLIAAMITPLVCVRERFSLPLMVLPVFLTLFLTESVLERQAGLVLVCLYLSSFLLSQSQFPKVNS